MPSSSKPRILVVDDEPGVRSALEAILSDEGLSFEQKQELLEELSDEYNDGG